jgi:DMATS type aromatic prenyltransferase
MSSNALREDLGTFFNLNAERLSGLCDATGLREQTPEILDLFRRLTSPWTDEPVGKSPRWPSLVGDDHTPYEFSLGLGETPELRLMAEPLGAVPSFHANQEAALGLLNSLARDFDVDLSRFEKVRDLFLPSNPHGTFGVWAAVGFGPNRAPEFKVYLDPEAQGRELAPKLIHEAVGRLGLPKAWNAISNTLVRRGELDELKYLSLDLSASPKARLKVYARHEQCSVRDLESAASASPWYQQGDVTQFLKTVAPDVDGVFRGRAPLTCYAFVQGRGDGPSSATTHFPINGYAKHDAEIAERVLQCLTWLKLPSEPYKRAMNAFANRPLERGIGLQAYVSFRRDQGKPRLTVYLPTEVYRPGTVAKPTYMEHARSALKSV